MDSIYSQASETLIYLGPSTKESVEALRTFNTYGHMALRYGILELYNERDPNDTFRFGYERWTLGPRDSYGTKILSEVISKIQSSKDFSSVKMLASIMQRPWWSRMWVLQELLLSPNPIFISGNQTISARNLVASLRLFEAALTIHFENLLSELEIRPTHNVDRTVVNRIRHETRCFHQMADAPALVLYTTQLRQQARSKFHGIVEPYFGLGNIWDLVQDISLSSQRLSASDPRDRIYALIGIASLSRVDIVTIKPDYTLTCAEVYARATHEFMRYTGARMLDVAARNRKRTSITDLPSWAVDWSLIDLMAAPLPSVDDLYINPFELALNRHNQCIIETTARSYGKAGTTKIELPALTDELDTNDRLDAFARLLGFLQDLYIYTQASFTTDTARQWFEGFIRAMILYSIPDDLDTEEPKYTSTRFKEAVAFIYDKTSELPSSQSHTYENSTDIAATRSREDGAPLDTSKFLHMFTHPDNQSRLESELLCLALDRMRNTIVSGAKIFVAGDRLIGAGPQDICDEDVLVSFEQDTLIFAVRPVEGSLYKLIGKVCVTELYTGQTTVRSSQTMPIGLA